jgi:polar amino acid transport system permease protein
MSTTRHIQNGFAILHPYRVAPTRMSFQISHVSAAILCFASVMVASSAWSESGPTMLSPLEVIAKWAPLLLTGFAFNIAISLLAMLLGTIAGLGLGLALLSEIRLVAAASWFVTQVFRNAPWLVLLFFVMFLVPFQVTIFKTTIPLPDWQKATVGFALPVMANVAEVVRGAVRSIPSTQWEAAESLSFTRRQTMWLIILPQCIKRMLPPWMNIYSLVTMSTVLASIVGVSEMLTLTAQVHAAEGGRPELFAPLYGFALLCFFLYCYPINLWTAHLERRFHVR